MGMILNSVDNRKECQLLEQPAVTLPAQQLVSHTSFKCSCPNAIIAYNCDTLPPMSMVQMLNIFSEVVFAETLPNPTLVRLEHVK
jgi:hypothetical protein